MKTCIIIIALLAASATASYSQYLTYKPGGKVFNSENKKLSTTEVEKVLANMPGLLVLYKKGRAKKTAGNVFMVGGVLLMAGDMLRGLTADVEYPGILTYIGGGCILVSIPIKIGAPGKVRKAVEGYNDQLSKGGGEHIIKNAAFISDRNGVGLRLTF